MADLNQEEEYKESIADLGQKHATENFRGLIIRARNSHLKGEISVLQEQIDGFNLEIKEITTQLEAN